MKVMTLSEVAPPRCFIKSIILEASPLNFYGALFFLFGNSMSSFQRELPVAIRLCRFAPNQQVLNETV